MMILRYGRAASALLGALAIAACSSITKSPAEGLTFTAPDGWKSSPGIMGMMQFWASPDKKQVLMLFKVPADFKVDQAYSSADVKDAHVESQRSLKLCGNLTGQYIKAIATSSRTGDDNNLEMVVVKGDAPETYMSMYVYPIGMQPDKTADAAIYQLCPAKP
jgi:hypothetical protein